VLDRPTVAASLILSAHDCGNDSCVANDRTYSPQTVFDSTALTRGTARDERLQVKTWVWKSEDWIAIQRLPTYRPVALTLRQTHSSCAIPCSVSSSPLRSISLAVLCIPLPSRLKPHITAQSSRPASSCFVPRRPALPFLS